MHNYCIAVKESGEDIVFLRKIIQGGADKSYGIQVAKLAGVPEKVLARAKEIAATLNENDIAERTKLLADAAGKEAQSIVVEKEPSVENENSFQQISLFDISKDPVIAELKSLDLSRFTPIAALNKLYELQEKIK